MANQQPRPQIHIDVRNLRFSRGERPIFERFSCAFPRGRISVVLGSSGSGKTTLLRMLGCLLKPEGGEIWVDGELELTGLPERQAQRFRRRLGMMFQRGALLDAITVFDNVALPLREHTSKSEAEIARDVQRVFESVGLKDVGDLLPGQLSGGMTKRAALARALIMEPDILLGDEPFSGLDPRTARLVEALLVEVNERLGVTIILASHHIASTLRIADQIVMLLDGSAVCGTPADMLRSTDPRVLEFLHDEGPVPHDLETSRAPEEAPVDREVAR
jgi:phospholipid/cholesterol/gamma-HCH transport system ATP-binding protein